MKTVSLQFMECVNVSTVNCVNRVKKSVEDFNVLLNISLYITAMQVQIYIIDKKGPKSVYDLNQYPILNRKHLNLLLVVE